MKEMQSGASLRDDGLTSVKKKINVYSHLYTAIFFPLKCQIRIMRKPFFVFFVNKHLKETLMLLKGIYL